MSATAIFLIVLAALWTINISRDTKHQEQMLTSRMERLGQQASLELERLSTEVSLDASRMDVNQRAWLSADVYQILARMENQGVFTLVAEDTLVFSTDSSASEPLLSYLKWGLRRRAEASDTPVIELMKLASQQGSKAQLVIAKAVKNLDGKTVATLCISWPDTAFNDLIGAMGATMVAADSFGKAFLESGPLFRSPLGKIDSALRTARGFSWIGGKPYYVSRGQALDGALSVYAASPLDTLMNTLLLMAGLTFAVFLATTIAIYLSSKHIARRKTKVINEMAIAFAKAKKGNLNTRLEVLGGDEFAIIADSFNAMLDSMEHLIQTNTDQARESVISKIKQLEAEFNPHFLFNTLENIRFMVRKEPAAASGMILDLSRLLRYSIKDDSEQVSLSEDMAFIENYLSILKRRFSDRLQYEFKIPPEFANCRIPRLIAQPVIENAVRYGLEKGSGALKIKVRLVQTNGKLMLTIKDNGPGIPHETLNAINRGLEQQQVNNQGHIGLRNVHKRLRLMFGENYGLVIRSQAGMGTAVHLVFPCSCGTGNESAAVV